MSSDLPRLRVSDNQRFLVSERGTPFFWLADTAWELFHRLTLAEAEYLLETRRQQGFTVIQAAALAELDGLHAPNANGDTPLHSDDPAQPNAAYFAHVDAVIAAAAARGLYVALLPTWGDKVTPQWGSGPAVFDAHNARPYGAWLAARYRHQPNIVWMIGGDRPAVYDGHDDRPTWRALAQGVRDVLGARALLTFHPPGGASSSRWLHDETWLDFNTMQSGHGGGRDVPVWERIGADYARTPTKPTLDSEPNYEDHPVNPWPTYDPANGYFRAYDVRKQCYRSVFAGGCGVTYGHHAVWQFYAPGRAPVNLPDRPWHEAIDRPGAWHIGHLRRLIESRPQLTRVPDQSLLLSDAGAGGAHTRATRDSNGSYALVYLPAGGAVRVRGGAVAGDTVRAWWFDPRTGAAAHIADLPAHAAHIFSAPVAGTDWVLVLDDAAQGFAPPGSVAL